MISEDCVIIIQAIINIQDGKRIEYIYIYLMRNNLPSSYKNVINDNFIKYVINIICIAERSSEYLHEAKCATKLCWQIENERILCGRN